MLEKLKKHKMAIIVTCVIVALLGGLTAIMIIQDNNNVKEVQTNERDTSVAQLEITTEYINIRENKDVNSNVLGKVKEGEIYTIISEDTESQYRWYEIETANGIKGFISGSNDYIRLLEIENTDSPDTEPEPTPDDTTPDNTQTKPNTNTNTNTQKPSTNTQKPSTNNTQKPSTNNSNTEKPNTNTSSNNNNTKPNTSNNNTNQETPKPAEKKVIDATVSKRCPSGYKNFNYNDEECWRNVITQNQPTLTCPSGYKLEGTSCVEVKPTLNAKPVPICASGAEPTYATNGGYSCRDGSQVIPYRCATGYTLTKNGADYICVYANPNKKKPTATCPNDESANTYPTTYCFYTETVPKKVYSCPSGYTLKGDKCYEN